MTAQTLSKYQRAVLNELGIVYWKTQSLISVPPLNADVKNLSSKEPSKNSQQEALEKLSQLKKTTTVSYKGKVLCAFELQHIPMVSDILLVLGLDTKNIQLISHEQIKTVKDFDLIWTLSSEVNVEQKQLTTPNLTEMSAADKKKLWQSIQHLS